MSRKVFKRIYSRNLFSNIFGNEKCNYGKYRIIKPGNVVENSEIPDDILKPSYYYDGEPKEILNSIEIKSKEQILKMTKSCKLAAYILDEIKKNIKIGQTTEEINSLVHNLSIENKAYPSPFRYKGFPKSVCTSVNNVACHGIPDDTTLEEGDIINVDITVYFEGYHGDCSKTFMIGKVDESGENLVNATKHCLDMGISICKPGRTFCSIGKCIEEEANKLGYNIIPAFIGHGIGSYFHGPPDIYHFANNYPGTMEPGMTFTIEPILTQGGEEIEILEDGWTAVTVDNSRTAQFEHTVLITDTGAEILTSS